MEVLPFQLLILTMGKLLYYIVSKTVEQKDSAHSQMSMFKILYRDFFLKTISLKKEDFFKNYK